MNGTVMTKTIKDFWNEAYKELKPMTLSKNDFVVEDDFSRVLKYLGDHAEEILEIGVGSGRGLLACQATGDKVKHLTGIDPSPYVVEFLSKTCELSGINNVSIIETDHLYLESLKSQSIDGIITSNVLDVLEDSISDYIINEITRILKPGGYFVVKVNFYLTEEIIERTKAEELKPNVYAINGVLRSVNRTTEEWLEKFQAFELVEKGTFERIQNGPLDRVMLLRKR